MNAFIRSAGAYVPGNKDTHADLEKRLNATDKRISSQSRIRKTLFIETRFTKKNSTVMTIARIFLKCAQTVIANKELAVIR